jgi:hypothetical protein
LLRFAALAGENEVMGLIDSCNQQP